MLLKLITLRARPVLGDSTQLMPPK